MTGEPHPRLPGRLAGTATWGDAPERWPVRSAESIYASGYLRVDDEHIATPDGDEAARVVVRPHGAVAVLAVDAQGRVLLIRQYRHPVGARVVEIPAGTLDVPGEDPLDAAHRELAEEADLRAEVLEPLLELTMSPGYSSERLRIYRAAGLSPIAEADRFARVHEEADLESVWMDLDAALEAVAAGRITDAKTVAALLAHRAAS